jgi:hypothetical protein
MGDLHSLFLSLPRHRRAEADYRPRALSESILSAVLVLSIVARFALADHSERPRIHPEPPKEVTTALSCGRRTCGPARLCSLGSCLQPRRAHKIHYLEHVSHGVRNEQRPPVGGAVDLAWKVLGLDDPELPARSIHFGSVDHPQRLPYRATAESIAVGYHNLVSVGDQVDPRQNLGATTVRRSRRLKTTARSQS